VQGHQGRATVQRLHGADGEEELTFAEGRPELDLRAERSRAT
jgi:hypothetical protein